MPNLSFSSQEFTVGNGYWVTLSKQRRLAVFLAHMDRASRILVDAHLPLPDESELESIVLASFRAFHAYVAAGVEKPGPRPWRQFFRSFVILCGLQAFAGESSKSGREQIASLDGSDDRHAVAN